MTTAIAPVLELQNTTDALELAPEFVRPTRHTGRDDVWLSQEIQARVVRSTLAELEICELIAEYDQQIGKGKGSRALFTEFCLRNGFSYWIGRQRVRIYGYIPPEFWPDFENIPYGTLCEIEARSHVKGDTDGERQARVLQACHAALAHCSTVNGARVLIEEARAADREARPSPDAYLLSEVGPDAAGDAAYEPVTRQPETVTEFYADTLRETPQDRYAGDMGLSPQTAGASTEEDLRYSALERRVQAMEAALNPRRLAAKLWPQWQEIGSRQALEAAIEEATGGVL